MIPENRNFEEFMNFRDMIQSGDTLNNRMEMVKYMSEKPNMYMSRGGSLNDVAKKEKEKRIASVGDSLAEVHVEAIITKKPNAFDNYFKQQAKLAKGADLIARGLASMPVAKASFGGFVANVAKDIGKSFVGDVVGAGLGVAVDRVASPDVANFLSSSVGKGLVGAGTNFALDYAFSDLFGSGYEPDAYSFGTDFALRTLSDYMATPESERAFFGDLAFGDKLDEEEKAKREAILAAQKDRIARSKTDIKSPSDFFGRVADYSRIRDPGGKISLQGLGARSIEPLGRSLLKATSTSQAPQGQGLGLQSISGNPYITKMPGEIGGQRGITVRGKVNRADLTPNQIKQLAETGSTIHKGKRITKQDLVGRTEFARRTQLVEAAEGGPLSNEEFVMSLMYPDQFSGMVGGDGHGMEDNVQMPIVSDGEQVATLAVSPKEYVVDAYTMSALGNGNADEGAKIMDETIKQIRRKAYGTSQQPNEINGGKALRSGLQSIA